MPAREDAQFDIDAELMDAMHSLHIKVMRHLETGNYVPSGDISRVFLTEQFDDLHDRVFNVLEDLTWQEVEDPDFVMNMRDEVRGAAEVALINAEQGMWEVLHELFTGQGRRTADDLWDMMVEPFEALRQDIQTLVDAAISEPPPASMSSHSASSSEYSSESQGEVVLPLRCRRRSLRSAASSEYTSESQGEVVLPLRCRRRFH